MPTRRATWLPLAAVVANGLLAGVSLDQSIKQLPTRQLVVDGPYRYVRNPMYLAVAAAIVGQALALGQPGLLGYAAVVGGAIATFAHGYEEPTLSRRFGAQYQAYRRAVPAWWPRRHPWQPGQANQPARHKR